MSAPCDNNTFTISACPLRDDKCKGVSPPCSNNNH